MLLRRVLKLITIGTVAGSVAGNVAAAESDKVASGAPSLELLEYIGMMVDAGAELVGPDDIAVSDDTPQEQTTDMQAPPEKARVDYRD